MRRMTHREARQQGVALWRGPTIIDLGEQEERFIFGHQLLHLACRSTGPTRLEARSLYALVADEGEEEQTIAVLRAVVWESQAPFGRITERHADGTATMLLSGERTTEANVAVQARFVEIPIAQGRAWIHAFDLLPLVLHERSDDAPTAQERYLKREWHNRVELDWQTHHPDYAELNGRWEATWDAMGHALRAHPVVTGVREYFPESYQPDVSLYDFEGEWPL